jgi:hypothetical protein
MAKTDKGRRADRPARRGRRVALVAGIVAASLVVLCGGGAVGATLYFDGRAHPGVELAGQSLAGLDAAALTAKVERLAGGQTLTVNLADGAEDLTTLTADASDVGLVVDVPATVEAALQADRDLGVVAALNPWRPKPVGFVASVDRGAVDRWVAANLARHGVAPKDATVRYDEAAGLFVTTPSAAGQAIDTAPLAQAVAGWAKDPTRAPTVDLTTHESAPAISDEAAAGAAAAANRGLDLTLTVSTDVGSFTVPRQSIAAWTVVTPKPAAGEVAVTHDAAAMRQELAAGLVDAVTRPRVDQVVETTPAGKRLGVVQHGSNGVALADQAAVVDQVIAALDKGEGLSLVAETTVDEFQTVEQRVDASGEGKWIDVNLSTFRVTPYVNDEPVNSFYVSYGKPGWETPVGTFKVTWTTSRDRMIGQPDPVTGQPEYDLMVDWVTYFTSDGVAFHSAPWAAPYGANVSHGCVNMAPAAAEWIYWWTPPGTTIVVHY